MQLRPYVLCKLFLGSMQDHHVLLALMHAR
jgi:hypothetical protein